MRRLARRGGSGAGGDELSVGGEWAVEAHIT